MAASRVLVASARLCSRARAGAGGALPLLSPSARRFVGPRASHASAGARDADATAAPPTDALKTYCLTGRGGGVAATVLARNHTIQTDVPKSMGGEDAAPQPVELVLAALVGCEQATAAYVARHTRPRFPLRYVHFDLRATRDERGAIALPIDKQPPVSSRLLRVEGTAIVHLSRGAESRARVEALGRRVEERCPVADMLRASGCELDVRWQMAKDFLDDDREG